MAKQEKSTSSKITRRPTHPGEIIRDVVLPELNLSVSEAARQLGVSRQMLHAILSGKSAVSAEMALRLGQFCGNGPELWLAMQQTFDLWQAGNRLSGKLNKIPSYKIAAE